MAFTIANPYIEKIAELVRQEDKAPIEEKEKLQKEIEELRKKSMDLTNEKLAEFEGRIDKIKEQKVELSNTPVNNKSDAKSMLKKVSNLYKDSVELYLSLREIRKTLKEQYGEK